MKAQADHHVQAWVRDRVKVLALLEELHAVTCKPCRREMQRSKWGMVLKACGR